MPFTMINGALADQVASPIHDYCITRFGRSGLKIESEIQPSLNWKPTLQARRSKYEIIAIEVSEELFPQIIKIAAHEIRVECPDKPISVYIATPLSSYASDTKQTTVKKLKELGYGLLTVDDEGLVTEQFIAIPIIHHIPQKEFSEIVRPLPSLIRVNFQNAFDVYKTNPYQGLQECGQIVEGLIFSLAKQSNKKSWIGSKPSKGAAATALDALYESTHIALQEKRASLGRARAFMKNYRNITSHPPKSFSDAATRIKNCRIGFIESIAVASELHSTHKHLGLTAKLHFP